MTDFSKLESDIKVVRDATIELAKMFKDPSYGIELLKRMSKIEIDEEIAEYEKSSGAVAVIRTALLHAIKNNEHVTTQFISDLMDRYMNKDSDYFAKFYLPDNYKVIERAMYQDKDFFKSWREPQKIMSSLICNRSKREITKNRLEAVGKAIITELELNNYKAEPKGFLANRSFGQPICFSSVIPTFTGGIEDSYQLFTQFSEGNIEAGIFQGANLVKKGEPEYQKKSKIFTTIESAIGYLKELKEEAIELNRNAFKKYGKVAIWLCGVGKGEDNLWQEFQEQNILAIGMDELGDLSSYTSKNDIKNKLKEIRNDGGKATNDVCAAYEISHVMKVGDIVFAKRGTRELLGVGRVTGTYYYDETRNRYRNVCKVTWEEPYETPKTLPEKIALKTLTRFSTSKNKDNQRFYNILLKIAESSIENEDEVGEQIQEDPTNDLFMKDEEIETIVGLLEHKKNIILQGAPGVGKTFMAKRIAKRMGADHLDMVQFHESYSYEDFVMGYRPTKKKNFELVKGRFYKFCKEAANNPDSKFVFIIDEINRGKISKIFGELLMLIEKDKRDEENGVHLMYQEGTFFIPSNVYIVGLMNTADRSIALMDFALRRRFAFYTVTPAFDNDKFIKLISSWPKTKNVVEVIKQLNQEIADDPGLGAGFEIGHSYFCGDDTEKNIKTIVEYEIIPQINEYWFDNSDKRKKWSDALKNVLKEDV